MCTCVCVFCLSIPSRCIISMNSMYVWGCLWNNAHTHTSTNTRTHTSRIRTNIYLFFADWKGYTHVRLDGSTNRVWREVLITQFNLWVSTTDSLVLVLNVILLLFTLQFLLNLLFLIIHFLCLSSLLSTTAMLCLFYSLLMIIFVSIRVTYSTIICQDINLFF